jgi:hypothetical protein
MVMNSISDFKNFTALDATNSFKEIKLSKQLPLYDFDTLDGIIKYIQDYWKQFCLLFFVIILVYFIEHLTRQNVNLFQMPTASFMK